MVDVKVLVAVVDSVRLGDAKLAVLFRHDDPLPGETEPPPNDVAVELLPTMIRGRLLLPASDGVVADAAVVVVNGAAGERVAAREAYQ